MSDNAGGTNVRRPPPEGDPLEIFGLSPFAGFTTWQTVGLLALYFVIFLLKGVFGYGITAALVVGGSLVVPPHHAVVLAALTNLLNQVQFLPAGIRDGDRKAALYLNWWVLPAIAVGVWLFTTMDSRGLDLAIGLFIFALVLVETLGLMHRATPWVAARARVAGPVAAVFSGLIAGFIGAGAVIFLSIYVRILCPEKVRFRATMVLISTIFSIWRVALLVVAGLLTATIALEALLLVPLAGIAGWLGTRAMMRLPGGMFFGLYQAMLLAAAALLVWRGLTGQL